MKWLDKLKKVGGSRADKNAVLSTPVELPASEITEEPRVEESPRVPEAQLEARVFDGTALPLSARETEIFLGLLNGMKMREIADKLNIKTTTVNGYCSGIYKKLGVNSRAQLILRYSHYREALSRKGVGG